MIRPLELFIGWRYARSREAGFFVSFITWASLIGVALGVAVLISILSIMNGFEAELRERFRGEVEALGDHLGRDMIEFWGYGRSRG